MNTRMIKTIWIEMSILYGHRWTSQYTGEVAALAMAKWGEELAALSDQQVQCGLRGCSVNSPDWPPSVGIFRRYCLGLPDDEMAVARALAGERGDALSDAIYGTITTYDRDRMNRKELRQCYLDAARVMRGRIEATMVEHAEPPPDDKVRLAWLRDEAKRLRDDEEPG